jgi:nitrate reductase assembly molybdenum cofactor insertion protein NarJ
MMTVHMPLGVDLLAALEKSKAHRRDLAIASRIDGEFDDVAAALKEEEERFALCVRLLRERQETQR